MTDSNYSVGLLEKDSYLMFKGVYNDFKSKAFDDYKFELAPLDYEDFISSIEKGYLQCIVLKENDIPTAFLVYTSLISEALELNIIHCLGSEDTINKSKMLIKHFLELTNAQQVQKVISYPMLGVQADLTSEINKLGFKFFGLAVLRFLINNASSERILENMKLSEKSDDYKIVGYTDEFKSDAINVIHNSFKETSDAIYDPRYLTIEGTTDIINKIVMNIYGDFLPEATSVLLYKGKAVGFVFANITGGKIANIPLVAIDNEHRKKGLAPHLLNRTVKTLVDWTKIKKIILEEINVTTETNNYKALKLYRRVGFKESYCYPQAYKLPNRE